ncbi:Testis-specific serine kinase substrate [Platysternon megacephalum]|uniref:Testis-specific serine kinase substrate n=1 Tax=Platysternon megacephalum TaxID=55544 RepID=A0A4D9DZK6_9SAUR|nr:Testis-specific serine kinase substrate [Platysternon megacephalum]
MILTGTIILRKNPFIVVKDIPVLACEKTSLPVAMGCVSAQSLGQMVECAVTPLLEELRHCGLPPALCPACQRLQKKIRELEQAALETHARAETLSSNLRLAQDEALRAKTYVERVRLSPQEKPPGLDPRRARLSSLQAQLSQDGGPQPPAPPQPR